SVPADLDAVCLRCLEKDPARRYRTAQELAAALERTSRPGPTPTPGRRRALPAVLVACLCLALAAVLAWLRERGGPGPAPATAPAQAREPRKETPREQLLRLAPEDVGFCLVLQDLRDPVGQLASSPFLEALQQSPLGETVLFPAQVRRLIDAGKQLGLDWRKL